MCGIAGWVDWQRDLSESSAEILRMTRTLTPRGPDGEGIWLSKPAALGHRRLSVIDREGGAQPMVASIGGRPPAVVVFSGEIYNFTELRGQLLSRGHTFRTRSDTEVLLHSYLEWGAAFVERLNGMFAFAIWDSAQEALLLVRDRLGVKPLYYAHYGQGLVFGSEPKALLANPLVPARVDAEGLNELLCFTQTPGHAVYRDMRTVRPGCIVRFDRSGCSESRYWQLESRAHTDDVTTSAETVLRILEDAVRMELVADVPLCAFLSGGLDSSAIVALASRQLAERGENLVTLGFDYEGREEHFRPTSLRPDIDTPYARLMARHAGSRHRELIITPDEIIDARAETLRARDLPACFADIGASRLRLFRKARQEATVALSGEAGDELFGGYPWLYEAQSLNAAAFPWVKAGEGLLPLLSPELLAAMKPREYAKQRYAEAMAEVPNLEGETGIERRAREMFYVSLTRWLQMLLDYEDRMSMRWGLEIRVPFCDHRLVEYAWNIPFAQKRSGDREKGILRDAVMGLVPDDVLQRRKCGFPTTDDPRYDVALRAEMRERLADPSSQMRHLADAGLMSAMLGTEPVAPGGVWKFTDTLATLLQLEDWLRDYRVDLILQ